MEQSIQQAPEQSPEQSPKRTPMTRDFSLSTYLPQKAVNELCNQDWIAHFVYIKHDKDTEKDGVTLKCEHVHILLRTVERMSYKALERRINRFTYDYYYGTGETPQNTFIEFTKDIDDAFRYLTHTTEKARLDGKYEYDELDMVSDNIGYWRGSYSSIASKKNNALDIVNDIENGLSERQLLVRYGREYLINRGKYREFFYAMTEQECPIITDDNGEISLKYGLKQVDRKIKEYEEKIKFLKAIKGD